MSASDSIPKRYSPPSLDGVRLRFSSQKPRLCFQFRSAFYWGVSDRSFFTRIASAVMQGEVIRFQLHLQDGDEIFTNFLREKQEESYGSVLLPIARITVSV